ncbi:MAG: zinc-binding dehydrogenase [Planctomycetota bacterium]
MSDSVTTHAVVFTAENRAELVPTTVPAPSAGEVRVRTLRSCVSPGTELRILSGKENGFAGWPTAGGYALCGEIESVGDDVDLDIGTPVVLQRSKHEANTPHGSHIGYALAPTSDCVVVPDGVSAEAAALSRVMSIGHRGARQAFPQIGESVALVGLGLIGLSAALTATLTGARVACFNRSTDRVEMARACGLEAHAVDGELADVITRVLPGGADVLIDATGSPATPAAAIPAVRELGWSDGDRGHARYVMLGSYNGDMPIPYFPAFHRELTVQFPRYTDNLDVAEVLRLLARGAVNVGPVLRGAAFSPTDANDAYAALRDRKRGLMTAVFDWTALA